VFKTYFIKKRKKYSNKRTIYKNRLYDSKREATDAMKLNLLMEAGKIRSITPQYRLDLKCNGKHITTHLVDFMVVLNNGKKKFVETKGFRTEVWRVKWKLTEANFPTIPYLVNPTERELLD
jgi:hypothetical protein